MKKYNVAVVGATGLVGSEFLKSLRSEYVKELLPIASENSKGKRIMFNQKEYDILTINEGLESKIDVAFFCAGSQISKNYAREFAKKGAIVIDNSSYFRMNDEIPLVVPEVNGEVLDEYKGKIIANPNCSTIQLVVILNEIDKIAPIKRVVVSTYQSVSGAGQRGLDELIQQQENRGKKGGLEAKVLPVKGDKKHYQMFNNILPQIDLFEEDGYTKEEHKMMNESKKILKIPKLPITVTTVRVPITVCHCESVNIETFKKFSINDVRNHLSKQDFIEVEDDVNEQIYPTPLNVSGKDKVYVGRIRRDNSIVHGMNLWIVADNVRKGAAINGLQILEYIIANKLI
ncbi:aspartate-semialdehyde dehydrogenase [Alkalicella caledoniensis]|uniref:Aspartate-semialdehyde dehydrogenase n=1 Tax=Alkalicella caledoniensis TaxID=2731377 RepID=A0A7G9WCR5_ALKCA|nr:aspartate-semialdehyde dehydrogenase [Alkalicella caledoniensis]QNO16477.1 aspartate-semialdehyde dehydrogenase [Alkalicella caledoniensis]